LEQFCFFPKLESEHNEETFFDLNVYNSRYNYQILFDDENNGFDWQSTISETGARLEWSWLKPNNSVIKAGYHMQLYHFSSDQPYPGP
jgi:hypothetical protein